MAVLILNSLRISFGHCSSSVERKEYGITADAGTELAFCVKTVFTARRYASAVYAVVACPPVRPSVRLSQAAIV